MRSVLSSKNCEQHCANIEYNAVILTFVSARLGKVLLLTLKERQRMEKEWNYRVEGKSGEEKFVFSIATICSSPVSLCGRQKCLWFLSLTIVRKQRSSSKELYVLENSSNDVWMITTLQNFSIRHRTLLEAWKPWNIFRWCGRVGLRMYAWIRKSSTLYNYR